MHNCTANRDTLIALALNPSDQTQSLPAELEACATCREEYAALRALLRLVDQTKQSALPPESFWPGYHARLRTSLEKRSNAVVSLPAAAARMSLGTLLGNLLAGSLRVPIPLAAALLIFLGASLVFAWHARRPFSAPPPIIVNKTVEVPVPQEKIREKVVTRFIYRDRDRRHPTASDVVATRHKESAEETPISLAGFKPTNEVKLTIIKGSYQR